MKVWIKNLGLDLDVKTSGIELQVSSNDEKQMGDLYVTKTGLIWCKGRTPRKTGKNITWEDFAAYMEAKK